MIEIEIDSNRGFVYGSKSMDLFKKYPQISYKIERTETISGISLFTIFITGLIIPENRNFFNTPGEIYCKHGKQLKYTSINRLPSEGWEELLDCWSCHNNEFKTMLDLKIKPRINGILISNFYLIAHPGLFSDCCLNSSRIFYNDLKISFSDSALIYTFFTEYFQSKNSITLEWKQKTYEIKLFYNCILIDDGVCNAIKVGIKESDKLSSGNDFANEYFIDKIFNMLYGNKVCISVLGYDLTFIKNK